MALQDSANAGRPADSQLTVTDKDVQCQDDWAVVGANDLVNKAQYTFVFQWTDGQWQRIPDRSAACASRADPRSALRPGLPEQLTAVRRKPAAANAYGPGRVARPGFTSRARRGGAAPGMSSTLMPTMASPSPRDTLAMTSGSS